MVELRKSEALKKATIFSLLIMIGLGPLVGNANAFIYGSSSPSGWTVWVQDTPNTPQTCPWYDDAKGASGQHCNELLYVGVAWDDLYVYVRWDVKCLTTEFAQVYYLLRVAVNASAPTTTPTHSLQFEFNKIQGTIYTNVTIRIPGSPKFITAWTSNTDLSIDAIIPPLNTTVVNNETALIGRYPGLLCHLLDNQYPLCSYRLNPTLRNPIMGGRARSWTTSESTVNPFHGSRICRWFS